MKISNRTILHTATGLIVIGGILLATWHFIFGAVICVLQWGLFRYLLKFRDIGEFKPDVKNIDEPIKEESM